MKITYYYTPISGFAWVGHRALIELAKASAADIEYKPFDILALFSAQGTVPPPKQGDFRLSYRREDMARWAAFRKVELNPIPAYWPAPSAPACKVILAAGELGYDVGDISEALMRGIWVEEKNLADSKDLVSILEAAGLPSQEIMSLADDVSIASMLETNTESAQSDGVFGSPTYIVGDTRFFGQDRLDFVGRALTV